jgi:hypothetical protein
LSSDVCSRYVNYKSWCYCRWWVRREVAFLVMFTNVNITKNTKTTIGPINDDGFPSMCSIYRCIVMWALLQYVTQQLIKLVKYISSVKLFSVWNFSRIYIFKRYNEYKYFWMLCDILNAINLPVATKTWKHNIQFSN